MRILLDRFPASGARHRTDVWTYSRPRPGQLLAGPFSRTRGNKEEEKRDNFANLVKNSLEKPDIGESKPDQKTQRAISSVRDMFNLEGGRVATAEEGAE